MRVDQETQRSRAALCIVDLGANGINVVGLDEWCLRRIVFDHLDYFQAMIGDDIELAEIVYLLQGCIERAWLN